MIINKKIISLLLVVSIICSLCVPVFATTADYTSGTTIFYDAQADNDGDGQPDATESYTVKVPAVLAPGDTGTVTLNGTWPSNRTVTVTASESINMVNSIDKSNTKKLAVSFNGIELAGSNTNSVSASDTITVAEMTDALFGTWEGLIEYNVEIEGPVQIIVENLGQIEVSDSDAEITFDPDTGEASGVVPPSENEPEIPEDIPEENLPEIIEFGYGNFEANTSYIPGTYEGIPYEYTYTRTKYPVSYLRSIWSMWYITKDENDNIVSVEPKDIALTDIDIKYSEYILYDFETEEYLEMEGVAGDSVELWFICNSEDDTLENIIYLAAYLKKIDGNVNRHVAQWDGTQYVAVDYDTEINAIDCFTETYTVTGTQTVEITAPSTSTEYVYIPAGTMKAEKGMTWSEWLTSDYNTTGFDNAIIRDANYNEVSYDTEIVAGEAYSIVANNIESGLYDHNNNLLVDWTTLVTTYKLNVEKDYYFDYNTATTSPYYVINNNTVLSTGAKLVIGDSITSIGPYAFKGCTSLRSVIIPDSVTSIGSNAFYGCNGLTSVTIPNSVTSIESYTFYGCTDLENITIPNSIIYIYHKAFYNCSSLTDITIPDGVSNIGAEAFCDCTSLTSITIPNSVSVFDLGAFAGCTGLTSITFNGTVTQWNNITKANGWNYNVPATEVICSDGVVSLK